MKFEVSTDKSRLQIDRIHRYLSEEAYWCLGIPRETVVHAIENSMCFGVYDPVSHTQVGFARVISDYATFAYLCDVYVETGARGHGASKQMMEAIVKHPDLQGLRRFCLTTRDAHGLYSQFGFSVTKTPANWMEIKDDLIYTKKR